MCHRRAQTLQGRLSPPMPHSAAQRTSIAVKKDVKQQLETYTTATTDESELFVCLYSMSDINLYMVSLPRQQRRSLIWPASTEHQRLGRVQSVSAWATARYSKWSDTWRMLVGQPTRRNLGCEASARAWCRNVCFHLIDLSLQ